MCVCVCVCVSVCVHTCVSSSRSLVVRHDENSDWELSRECVLPLPLLVVVVVVVVGPSKSAGNKRIELLPERTDNGGDSDADADANADVADDDDTADERVDVPVQQPTSVSGFKKKNRIIRQGEPSVRATTRKREKERADKRWGAKHHHSIT